MGKVKIGGYCFFIADISTKSFKKMFIEWSCTKHMILFLNSQFDFDFVSKFSVWFLSLIASNGNWKAKFAYTQKKNQILRSYNCG